MITAKGSESRRRAARTNPTVAPELAQTLRDGGQVEAQFRE
jgi:hypothetical protein